MANINSSYISVFPSVKRDQSKDYAARHLSESVVAGIVNKLIDKDYFVITDKGSLGADNSFLFNIHGYVFNVQKLSYITSSVVSTATNVYATIVIDNSPAWGEELQGIDEDNIYKGVSFTEEEDNTQPASGKKYSVRILTRASTSDTWEVPEDAYVKFTGKSYDLTSISGGTLS